MTTFPNMLKIRIELNFFPLIDNVICSFAGDGNIVKLLTATANKNLVNFIPDGNPSFIFSTKNQYIFNEVIRFIQDKIVRGVELKWIQSPYDKNRDFNNIDNNRSI